MPCDAGCGCECPHFSCEPRGGSGIGFVDMQARSRLVMKSKVLAIDDSRADRFEPKCPKEASAELVICILQHVDGRTYFLRQSRQLLVRF